jgi:hypothetical protein
MTKEKGLHLSAINETVRNIWLAGIKHVFASSKKSTTSTPSAIPSSPHTNEPAHHSQPMSPIKPMPVHDKTAAANAPEAAIPIEKVTESTTTTAVPTSISTGNILQDGRIFKSYFSKSDSSIYVKNIFVFHEPNENKLGIIYYCDENKREKLHEQGLLVHRISDVFLGKQSIELKSKLAESELNSRCFSICTKDLSLHLVADTDTIRNEWLDAIRGIFSATAKKADASKAATPVAAANGVKTEKPVQKVEEKPVQKVETVVTPVKQTQTTTQSTPIKPTESTPVKTASPAPAPVAASPASPSTDQSSLLYDGTYFTSYTGTNGANKQNIFVWYTNDTDSGKLGTLNWNTDGKNDKIKQNENVIYLHRISGNKRII